MDARQMAAMAEATRLTRQGRLVEATALIQQTLAGQAVTRPAAAAPPAGRRLAARPAAARLPGQCSRAGQGTQTAADPSRLDYPPTRGPQPGHAGSPPDAPARGPGRAPARGPV